MAAITRFEGWMTKPTSPVTEALAALRQTDAGPAGSKLLLAYTPVARMNPFQALLYSAFAERGIAVSPVNVSASFAKTLDVNHLGVPVAVNLHWLNFVIGDAENHEQARSRVDEFAENLFEFKEGGGKIVWTVHNRLPHDVVYPEEEMRLRRIVAASADVIHTMSEGTRDALLPDIDLPAERIVVVPHPSYKGSYPDIVSKEHARQALGIEPDEFVYALLGAIKPYKGLDELLDAFAVARAQSGRRMRLIVAGQPDNSSEAQDFVRRCEIESDILVSSRKIPADDVQYYLRAADVGLAPYRRVLNSGAVFLYNAFGLPAIVPDDSALLSSLRPESYWEFGSNRSLADALMVAASETPGSRASAIAASEQLRAANRVSLEFADLLLSAVAASAGS